MRSEGEAGHSQSSITVIKHDAIRGKANLAIGLPEYDAVGVRGNSDQHKTQVPPL